MYSSGQIMVIVSYKSRVIPQDTPHFSVVQGTVEEIWASQFGGHAMLGNDRSRTCNSRDVFDQAATADMAHTPPSPIITYHH